VSATARFTAVLRCGTVLTYETPNLRPRPGEVVPCFRHGYCAVGLGGTPAARTEQSTCSTRARSSTRGRPRTQEELLVWLQGRDEASLCALRRHGFTLRLVAAAERDGLVDVDVLAGRVAPRPLLDDPPVPAADPSTHRRTTAPPPSH
jgi:hypothetical protein